MKTLVLLLVWALLPISVNAGVKFETYNAASDTASLNVRPVTYAVITLQRIECDTSIWAHMDRGVYIEEINEIACDTIFRIQFENVRVPVYLDSLQWQQLLRILGE